MNKKKNLPDETDERRGEAWIYNQHCDPRIALNMISRVERATSLKSEPVEPMRWLASSLSVSS